MTWAFAARLEVACTPWLQPARRLAGSAFPSELHHPRALSGILLGNGQSAGAPGGGAFDHPEAPQLAAQVSELAHLIFTQKIDPRSHLSRWLLRTDGDFLLVLVHKADGCIYVINDVFGRLPTYIHLRDGWLILSRDLRRVTQVLGAADFDRMATAQYLLLGFPLGNRSWFAGIKSLEPGALVRIAPPDFSLQVTRLHQFNIEGEEHSNQSSRENARNLASRFREACLLRATGDGTRAASLSGGLDSRAVAAGLRREEIPFTTATFLNSQQTNAGTSGSPPG